MIKMIILMDEDKIKNKSDLSVIETYKKIDDIAKRIGIQKKEDFCYMGEEQLNDNYAKFIKFHWELKKHSWFLNFISVWTYEDKYDFDDFKQYYIERGIINP